jgi:ABC-type transporter Mla subunit MlaD
MTAIQSETKGHEDIESVLAILHGEVSGVEVNTTSESIDKWIDILNGYKGEYKEILANLKELNKLLKSQNSDAGEIVQLLVNLGEQTTAIGDDAASGIKGPLHTLGKALVTFSHKVQRHANAQ